MAQSYDFQSQLCPAAEPANEHGKGHVYVREHAGDITATDAKTLAFPMLSKFLRRYRSKPPMNSCGSSSEEEQGVACRLRHATALTIAEAVRCARLYRTFAARRTPSRKVR
jgi:hypothetical protein